MPLWIVNTKHMDETDLVDYLRAKELRAIKTGLIKSRTKKGI